MFWYPIIRTLWIRSLLLILDNLSELIIESIIGNRNRDIFDRCISCSRWLIVPLKKSGCLLIISSLQGIREPVLAHYLCVEEVVHGPDLLKELFVVGKVEGRKHPLKRSPSLILVLSLLEQKPLFLCEFINLFGLHRSFPWILTSWPSGSTSHWPDVGAVWHISSHADAPSCVCW